MEFLKISGLCFGVLVIVSLLRQYNPGGALITALACCMVMLAFILRLSVPILDFVKTLSQLSGFEYLECVLKAVAIALITQNTEDLCAQAGQTAMAGRLELAGKTAILAVSIPLFADLTENLAALLN